jgi:hypothetical protein
MVRDQIWIHEDGATRSAEITSPARWGGEGGCIVGPFSNEAAARNFAGVRRPKRLEQRYFVRGDAWYLELIPLSD